MEISRQSSGDFVVLCLNGRLDANWCNHVETALSNAVRGGEHRLHVDMSSVSYISSAGLRVLLTCFKQLRAINGRFGVIRPSEAVRSVLELSGLQMLITSEVVAVAAVVQPPPAPTVPPAPPSPPPLPPPPPTAVAPLLVGRLLSEELPRPLCWVSSPPPPPSPSLPPGFAMMSLWMGKWLAR